MTEKQKNKEAFWQTPRSATNNINKITALIFIICMAYSLCDRAIMPSFLRGYGETTYAVITRIGKYDKIYKFSDKGYHRTTGYEARGIHPDIQPGDTIAVKYLKAFPKINKSVDETQRCVLSVKGEE